MSEPRTLCELFQQSARDLPRPSAYLVKVDGVYRAVGSADFARRVQAIAMGLRELGVRPGDRVALISENRLEWALADYAILHCGAITVPIYSTLQPSAVTAMLANCGAVVALVSNAAQRIKLDGALLPELRHVVLFDGEPPAGGIATTTLAAVEARGAATGDAAAFEATWKAVQPSDIATIIYTSGTSGSPKGVVLTHANLVSNILAVLKRVAIRREDTCLSFLPLSHVLERNAGHFVMWHVGATIALAESVEAVPQNLLEVRPTVLISVPRLYEKMNARVLAAIAQAPPLRRRLFFFAQRVGRERVRRLQEGKPVPFGLALQCRIADRLVFTKLRARMGGRLKLLISGGAPLAPDIAYFFFAAGLPILEGYGLTETSPVLCVNGSERPKIGTVGPALDGIEVRIGADGEIIARGPCIMQGYWNDPASTQAVLRDGWFHTGDVGELDADGYLRITDRIKDLLVTAGGKKVAPQPIESRLKASQFVAEVILLGDQRKYVSALVVPNFANLEIHARGAGVAIESRAELVTHAVVVRLYEELFGELNVDLAPFERIKRFRLLERELEHTTGELTPSMKVKRNVVTRTFAALIEAMYVEPPPAGVGSPPTGTSGHEAAALPEARRAASG
jgi:long-chain acyl-CoA synthetase